MKIQKKWFGPLTVACYLVFSPSLGISQEVYGRVSGFNSPQRLSTAQIEDLKTVSHGAIPTWFAIITQLNSSSPRLHIIDTKYFKKSSAKYGTHNAYAQQMGIVSGPRDFIAKLKATGHSRSIMPFVFYIPNKTLKINGLQADWVLQNRRYVFKDSSNEFAASLNLSQKVFQENLVDFVYGKPLFITFQKRKTTWRPNLLTKKGRSDIKSLRNQNLEVITETEMEIQAN